MTKLIVNGLTFNAVIKETSHNSTMLFGDSIVRHFNMSEIDKVCLPGGRCEDFRAIIQASNFSRTRVAILMFGGNDLESRYKGRIWRQRLSPEDILQQILEIAFFLSNREVAVYVVGIPHRGNHSFADIKELNTLLFNNRCQVFNYVGLGSQLSKAAVIGQDGVHLNEEGLSRLKTIFKNKILKHIQ